MGRRLYHTYRCDVNRENYYNFLINDPATFGTRLALAGIVPTDFNAGIMPTIGLDKIKNL